jgi:putative DNA primase/helicase
MLHADLGADHTVEQLGPTKPNGKHQSPGEAERIKLTATPLGEFCRINFAPREHIIAPILPLRGTAMLYAGRGVGKTRVGMGLSYAAASGGEFLRWRAPKPRRVLYVDGEMPAELMKERALSLMAAASYNPPEEEFFRLLAVDCQPLGTSLNLARPEHQAAVEKKLEGAELLVLDNLSTLVNGGRENDAESWDGMQSWLLHLRRKGISVLPIPPLLLLPLYSFPHYSITNFYNQIFPLNYSYFCPLLLPQYPPLFNNLLLRHLIFC